MPLHWFHADPYENLFVYDKSKQCFIFLWACVFQYHLVRLLVTHCKRHIPRGFFVNCVLLWVTPQFLALSSHYEKSLICHSTKERSIHCCVHLHDAGSAWGPDVVQAYIIKQPVYGIFVLLTALTLYYTCAYRNRSCIFSTFASTNVLTAFLLE